MLEELVTNMKYTRSTEQYAIMQAKLVATHKMLYEAWNNCTPHTVNMAMLKDCINTITAYYINEGHKHDWIDYEDSLLISDLLAMMSMWSGLISENNKHTMRCLHANFGATQISTLYKNTTPTYVVVNNAIYQVQSKQGCKFIYSLWANLNNHTTPNHFTINHRHGFKADECGYKLYNEVSSALRDIGAVPCCSCGRILYYKDVYILDIPVSCQFYCDHPACFDAYTTASEDGYAMGSIKEYNYKPAPKFHNVHEPTKTYFGVEIEVENVGFVDKRPKNRSIRAAHDISSAYKWIYCKKDSSITEGFEMVSEPLSFRWMQTNKSQLIGLLGLARKLGLRSFEPGTCGMHVHISRNKFNSAKLYNFVRFFYCNQERMSIISHRNKDELDTYASLSLLSKAKYANIDNYGEDACIPGHHGAICLQNRDTVEVRIFRGTLDFHVFMRNIEFLMSLVEFTPSTDIVEPNFCNYADYVCSNKNDYPEFYRYLTTYEPELIKT